MPICRNTAWVVLFPWFKSCGEQSSAPTVAETAQPATTPSTPAPTTAASTGAITTPAKEPPAETSSEHNSLPSGEASTAQSTDFDPSAPPEYVPPPPYNPAYDPNAPQEELKDFDPPPTYEESQQAYNQQNPPTYDAGKSQDQGSDEEKKLPEPEVTTKAEAKQLASIHLKLVEKTLRICKTLNQKLSNLVHKKEVKTLGPSILTLATQLQGYRQSIKRDCEKIFSYTMTAKNLKSKTEADKLFTQAWNINNTVTKDHNDMMNLLRAKGVLPMNS